MTGTNTNASGAATTLPPGIDRAAEDAITRALDEDLSGGDVTSEATIDADATGTAVLVAKARLCVAGLGVAARTFARLDPAVRFEARVRDGEVVQTGAELAAVAGLLRPLLAAERTALNLLQRLSGTATLTRAHVDAAQGRCRIVDTRKTTPGLRTLQRYAVRSGGGHNHRDDLAGGVLIKENHIRGAGGVAAAVKRARARAPHGIKVQCEVETLEELDTALAAGAEAVLLDNMDDATVREAVSRVGGRAVVEVSGGITLARIDVLAAAGVDVISVGALTHSAPAADISLLLDAGDGGPA